MYDQMSPEQLQQLIELGGLDEQQQRIQQQMALAQQLRPHSTGLGAALDGLGGLVGTIGGGIRNKDIQGKQNTARMSFAQALADALGRKKVEQEALGLGSDGPSALGDFRMYPGMG